MLLNRPKPVCGKITDGFNLHASKLYKLDNRKSERSHCDVKTEENSAYCSAFVFKSFKRDTQLDTTIGQRPAMPCKKMFFSMQIAMCH